MRRWFVAHTYLQLAVQLLAGGAVYTLCVGWAYVKGRAFHVADLGTTTEDVISEMASVPPALESFQDEV